MHSAFNHVFKFLYIAFHAYAGLTLRIPGSFGSLILQAIVLAYEFETQRVARAQVPTRALLLLNLPHKSLAIQIQAGVTFDFDWVSYLATNIPQLIRAVAG